MLPIERLPGLIWNLLDKVDGPINYLQDTANNEGPCNFDEPNFMIEGDCSGMTEHFTNDYFKPMAQGLAESVSNVIFHDTMRTMMDPSFLLLAGGLTLGCTIGWLRAEANRQKAQVELAKQSVAALEEVQRQGVEVPLELRETITQAAAAASELEKPKSPSLLSMLGDYIDALGPNGISEDEAEEEETAKIDTKPEPIVEAAASGQVQAHTDPKVEVAKVTERESLVDAVKVEEQAAKKLQQRKAKKDKKSSKEQQDRANSSKPKVSPKEKRAKQVAKSKNKQNRNQRKPFDEEAIREDIARHEALQAAREQTLEAIKPAFEAYLARRAAEQNDVAKQHSVAEEQVMDDAATTLATVQTEPQVEAPIVPVAETIAAKKNASSTNKASSSSRQASSPSEEKKAKEERNRIKYERKKALREKKKAAGTNSPVHDENTLAQSLAEQAQQLAEAKENRRLQKQVTAVQLLQRAMRGHKGRTVAQERRAEVTAAEQAREQAALARMQAEENAQRVAELEAARRENIQSAANVAKTNRKAIQDELKGKINELQTRIKNSGLANKQELLKPFATKYLLNIGLCTGDTLYEGEYLQNGRADYEATLKAFNAAMIAKAEQADSLTQQIAALKQQIQESILPEDSKVVLLGIFSESNNLRQADVETLNSVEQTIIETKKCLDDCVQQRAEQQRLREERLACEGLGGELHFGINDDGGLHYDSTMDVQANNRVEEVARGRVTDYENILEIEHVSGDDSQMSSLTNSTHTSRSSSADTSGSATPQMEHSRPTVEDVLRGAAEELERKAQEQQRRISDEDSSKKSSATGSLTSSNHTSASSSATASRHSTPKAGTKPEPAHQVNALKRFQRGGKQVVAQQSVANAFNTPVKNRITQRMENSIFSSRRQTGTRENMTIDELIDHAKGNTKGYSGARTKGILIEMGILYYSGPFYNRKLNVNEDLKAEYEKAQQPIQGKVL